jgi:hypothetical protein
VLFVIGISLGLVVANIVLIIYLLVTAGDVMQLPYWSLISICVLIFKNIYLFKFSSCFIRSSQYLIFRGSFLVLLMLWFTGVNMFVWSSYKVNYRYVAELTVTKRKFLFFFCYFFDFCFIVIQHPAHNHFDLFVLLGPLTAISSLLFTLYLLAARNTIPTISPRWFGFIQVCFCFEMCLLLIIYL